MGRRENDDGRAAPRPALRCDHSILRARHWTGMADRLGDAPGVGALSRASAAFSLGKHGGGGACPEGRGAAAGGLCAVADGLLSAAARRLGEMWQRRASFLEVSIAVSLIFRLNHEHAQRHVPIAREPDLRQAVFATLPGQAHNLGLVLAAEAFRQADWQVTLLLDTSMGMILDRVRRLRPESGGAERQQPRPQAPVGAPDRGSAGAAGRRSRSCWAERRRSEVYAALPSSPGVVVVHDIQKALDRV
jgi:hypothetical protein